MHEAPPFATDPSKFAPPMFGLPSPTEQVNAVAITFHQKNWRPAVVEDGEKGIIVEDVDKCAWPIDDRCAWPIGAFMGHKRMPMIIIEEQGIPRAG